MRGGDEPRAGEPASPSRFSGRRRFAHQPERRGQSDETQRPDVGVRKRQRRDRARSGGGEAEPPAVRGSRRSAAPQRERPRPCGCRQCQTDHHERDGERFEQRRLPARLPQRNQGQGRTYEGDVVQHVVDGEDTSPHHVRSRLLDERIGENLDDLKPERGQTNGRDKRHQIRGERAHDCGHRPDDEHQRQQRPSMECRGELGRQPRPEEGADPSPCDCESVAGSLQLVPLVGDEDQDDKAHAEQEAIAHHRQQRAPHRGRLHREPRPFRQLGGHAP